MSQSSLAARLHAFADGVNESDPLLANALRLIAMEVKELGAMLLDDGDGTCVYYVATRLVEPVETEKEPG